MFNLMLAWYLAHSAATAYDIGFIYDGKLYHVRRAHLTREWLKADRCSSKRGGWQKIRIRLSAKVKAALVLSGEAQLLGGAELLETADRYNKGERYERIITELEGQVWSKDNVPFWVAGDISLNGEEIQVKFDGAELTNELTMARAEIA